MTSRPPATLDQSTAQSKKAVAATITGVDDSGQLFRDSAQVVFLKGLKCVYRTKVKPSSDNALMIEIRSGEGPWRSDAKVRSVSPATGGQDGFRVAIGLERTFSSTIEAEAEEEIPEPKAAQPAPVERDLAANVSGSAVGAGSGAPAETIFTVKEITTPESEGNDVIADIVRSIVASETAQWKQDLQDAVSNQVQAALQQPIKAIEAKIEQQFQSRPAITEESVRKIAAQAAERSQIEKADALQKSIAETVRTAVGSVDEAVRKRVEARLKEQTREQPAFTEDAVRRVATQVAEATQLEWASSKLQKIIAEAVRSAIASDSDQRKAQTAAQVSAEVVAFLRGPLAAQVNAGIEKLLPRGVERYLQAPTDAGTLQKLVAEAVRKPLEAEFEQRAMQIQTTLSAQTAAQASADIAAALGGPLAARMDANIEKAVPQGIERYFQAPAGASTLQKLLTEAVRKPLEAEFEQRAMQIQTTLSAQTAAQASADIAAALGGPLAARMDANIEKAVPQGIERYFQAPAGASTLQKLLTEAVRKPLEAEFEQRAMQIQTTLSAQTAAQASADIAAALGGPLLARMDANIEKAVPQGIERYFQAPAGASTLQKLLTEAVRKPLEAEFEQRAMQIQTVVSREISAAVHGPVASQMDEMLKAALEQQRAEYLRTPPPITEDTIRIIAARVAEHPQLLGAIDGLTATLSARWAAIARSATTSAQEDISSRIAAGERLTNQVISDIQRKLDSFSVEMTRIMGSQEAGPSSEGSSQPPSEPERDKRFRELLQSSGSNFEREMKSVLQKIFGKS